MAVTGLPVIAPASGNTGVLHHMSNLDITVLSNQDGVWSCPAAGSKIDNIHIINGNGVTKYGMRVGADISASRGQYSNISLVYSSGDGLYLTHAEECQFSNIDIDRVKAHGINLDLVSDRNQFNTVMLNTPSRFNSGVSDGIHITDGDSNTFDGVTFDPSAAAVHKSAFDLSGGIDNRVGACVLIPGTVEAYLETTIADNDFGMDVARFVIAGTVAVSTGTVRLYAEVDRQIYACRVVANTAPTGANLIVDVNLDGATIYTTAANRPTIIAAANVGAWTLPDRVASAGTQIAKGSYMSVDVDQIGSTIAGADLTVEVMWRKE